MIYIKIILYADVIFFINFFMNFIVYFISSKLLKRRTKIIRIMFASFSTALLYCSSIFVKQLNFLSKMPYSLIIISLGIIIAFKPKNIKIFARIYIYTMITTFVIAGVSSFILMNSKMQSFISHGISYSLKNFSFFTLLLSTVLVYFLLKINLNRIRAISIKNQRFYPISLKYKEKVIELEALLDTGNSLHDLDKGYDIVIAEFSLLRAFLDEKMKESFYNHEEVKYLKDNNENYKDYSFLEYKSLGNNDGTLLCLEINELIVFDENKEYPNNKVKIAIYNDILSSDNNFQAIISPRLLEN